MALPLLYQELINEQFDRLVKLVDERLKQAKMIKRTSNVPDQREAAGKEIQSCPMLVELLDYFESYWINTITSEMFCVQGLQYRTNNLAEGMHLLS
jgi:hypothetical protein